MRAKLNKLLIFTAINFILFQGSVKYLDSSVNILDTKSIKIKLLIDTDHV